MTDATDADTEPAPPLSDSEKLDRILEILAGVANTLVEHDVTLKMLAAQVEIHSEDDTSMRSELRHVRKAVDELTTIAKRHDSQIREDRKSIHDLQAEEKRRIASGRTGDER